MPPLGSPCVRGLKRPACCSQPSLNASCPLSWPRGSIDPREASSAPDSTPMRSIRSILARSLVVRAGSDNFVCMKSRPCPSANFLLLRSGCAAHRGFQNSFFRESIRNASSSSLHIDRVAGGDRHHRRADRPAAAGGSGGPRGRPASPVRQQPQATGPRHAELPFGLQLFSGRVPLQLQPTNGGDTGRDTGVSLRVVDTGADDTLPGADDVLQRRELQLAVRAGALGRLRHLAGQPDNHEHDSQSVPLPQRRFSPPAPPSGPNNYVFCTGDGVTSTGAATDPTVGVGSPTGANGTFITDIPQTTCVNHRRLEQHGGSLGMPGW